MQNGIAGNMKKTSLMVVGGISQIDLKHAY